jgi:hypothetical protein
MEGFPGNVGRKPEAGSCWKCGFASIATMGRMKKSVAGLGEFASVSVKVTWNSSYEYNSNYVEC